jgi:cyclase
MGTKVRLITALLLRDGTCYKGVRFADHRSVGNPVTNARVFDAQGADELLLLDTSASTEGRQALLEVVEAVASQCFMPLGVGGGVRSLDDIGLLLRSGADKVVLNSAAVERPEFITEAARTYGSANVMVSIDYRLGPEGSRVTTHAGTRPSALDPVAWAKEAVDRGAGELLLTCIDREGTRQGYDIPTLRQVSDGVPVPVIASGGAGTLDDLVQAVREGGASAVAAGTLLHFTDQSLIKARYHMRNAGLDVRIA